MSSSDHGVLIAGKEKVATRCELSLISKEILSEVSEQFSAENKFSDESLLQLHGIFGNVFDRAVELHELSRVTKICSTPVAGISKKRTDARWFLQVKGISGEQYTLFPGVNFCSCAAFRYHVINDEVSYTCKHVLAGWLSSLDTQKLCVQEITSTHFRDLLKSQLIS